jgi:hypothetical protein
VTKDVKFEGWIFWRGFFPVARYRIISKLSWFGRAWSKWYGHGMLGCIIHRDEVGSYDDKLVEETIVHEIRHHVQQLVLGLIFYLVYGFDLLMNGYWDVWFEKDARRAEENWKKAGRPLIFKFGKRR